jgi:hypothetical protein
MAILFKFFLDLEFSYGRVNPLENRERVDLLRDKVLGFEEQLIRPSNTWDDLMNGECWLNLDEPSRDYLENVVKEWGGWLIFQADIQKITTQNQWGKM